MVMPTYNKGEALNRTLKSIFDQSPNFNFEVIVIDDGSSDNTKEICEKYPNIVYHYLDRPYYTNPAKARNIGYSLAKGEIIINQSSEVEHIGECITGLVENLKPNKFLIATVLNVCPDSGNTIMEYTGLNFQRPLFFLGSIYRKDVLSVGGDSEDFIYPGYEDTWFAFCLMAGLGLRPEYRTDIIGKHWDHPRTENYPDKYKQMEKLYLEKIAKAQRGGVLFNNGIKEI